jgi:hypothetical protein
MSRSDEKKRLRLKGRGESGRYAGVPTIVMDSPNWMRLTGSAVKLVLEFAYQYNGYNNGDLTAAYSILKKRHWRSQNTINWAVKELIHYGMIIKTRQGTLDKRPNLFALTWRAIDDNNGKMDLCSATKVSPGNWRIEVNIFNRKTAPKLVKRKKKY